MVDRSPEATGPRSRPRSQPRSAARRAEILAAAEEVFAEHGYAAARLEDVALRVGIRRASLVYYFPDKRALYDAVLASVFGALRSALEAAFAATPLGERLAAAVSTWVRFVGERPTLVRILLREVADGPPRPGEPSPVEHARPLLQAAEAVVGEGQRAGLYGPVDLVHLGVVLAGATAFYVAATPALGADWPFDPLSETGLERHRQALLRIAETLLEPATSPLATPGRDTR
jgi:TetR/AcrR family transcriptional regulator